MNDTNRFDAFQDLGHTHALQTYALTQTYDEKVQGEEHVVELNDAPDPAVHLDMITVELANLMDKEFSKSAEQGSLGLTLRAAATGYWAESYRDSFFEFMVNGLPEDMELVEDEVADEVEEV